MQTNSTLFTDKCFCYNHIRLLCSAIINFSIWLLGGWKNLACINNSFHLAWREICSDNCPRYLSTVFLELRFPGKGDVRGQTSERILEPNLQIFFETCVISLGYSPVLAGEYLVCDKCKNSRPHWPIFIVNLLIDVSFSCASKTDINLFSYDNKLSNFPPSLVNAFA